MPKVEAKDRHRLRPTPLPRPRFPTLRAKDHTYEFDRNFLSLRISGSGYQDFLSSGDARALYGFLRRIYEPAVRPATSLRLDRRARRHSQRQAKQEADTGAKETNQKPLLDFGEEYYNSPSWRVATIMTSFDETREQLEALASYQPGGRGNVRRFVLGSVEHWKAGKPTPHKEAVEMLVQDFLMGGVRRVEWTPVYDTLRGEKAALPEDANVLTTITYQLLQQTDWQAIVKDAKSLSDADTQLQDWLEGQLLTWAGSSDARSYQSPVTTFANNVLELYFQAVQWDKVTQALRSE